jgi:CheY-like chemotaxis protein
MQTAGDPDKDKIQRRGKQVTVTTRPVWLIADSDPTRYKFWQFRCYSWDIDTIIFTTGDALVAWIDAVERAAIQTSTPQLAILDTALPGLAVSELGAKIRSSNRLRKMALVLTATYTLHRLTREEEVEILRTNYADALIYQPYPPPDKLRQTLQDIIARPR